MTTQAEHTKSDHELSSDELDQVAGGWIPNVVRAMGCYLYGCTGQLDLIIGPATVETLYKA